MGLWILFVMCLAPTFVALLWFVAVPLGNTYSPYFRDKAQFIFFVNPGTQCIFCFLIIQLFMSVIDESSPWRPASHYMLIIIANYVAQLIVPGSIVGAH